MIEAPRYTKVRKSQRFTPSQPLTVAMSNDGASFAYGIVSNISEGGACFQTNLIPRHGIVDLVLSFYNGEYVHTAGRIVWSDSDNDIATVGVEFTGLTDEGRRFLRSTFGSGSFTPV
jgi:hypothetical protein